MSKSYERPWGRPESSVQVPTLSDTPATIRFLFENYSRCLGGSENIHLDFSSCDNLSAVSLAFLFGWITQFGKDDGVFIDWNTTAPKIRKKLGRHLDYVLKKDHHGAVADHTVPSRLFVKGDPVVAFLREHWLEPGWLILSDNLKDALAGRTYEMFLNAFEHSQSPTVFCSGEHLGGKQPKLKLAIVDFGIGIPGTVRPYVEKTYGRKVTDTACLRWAMQDTATTKTDRWSRGVGLGLITDMVKLNKGRLDIYSHGAHVMIRGGEQSIRKFSPSFHGTLLNISFQCDNLYYSFKDEGPPKPLF